MKPTLKSKIANKMSSIASTVGAGVNAVKQGKNPLDASSYSQTAYSDPKFQKNNPQLMANMKKNWTKSGQIGNYPY